MNKGNYRKNNWKKMMNIEIMDREIMIIIIIGKKIMIMVREVREVIMITNIITIKKVIGKIIKMMDGIILILE